jgi:hypothetical protein
MAQFLTFFKGVESLMNTVHVVVVSCLIACLGGPVAAHAPGAADRLTIRFDGLHEVLSGGEDPLKIGIGPESSLRRGTLTYCEASFESPGADKKATAKRKARDILGADRFPIEVEFRHQDAKEKPVRVKGYLRPDACCGRSLEGFFRVPDEARLGDAKIMIVWGDGKESKGGSVTVLVSINAAK